MFVVEKCHFPGFITSDGNPYTPYIFVRVSVCPFVRLLYTFLGRRSGEIGGKAMKVEKEIGGSVVEEVGEIGKGRLGK